MKIILIYTIIDERLISATEDIDHAKEVLRKSSYMGRVKIWEDGNFLTSEMIHEKKDATFLLDQLDNISN